VGFHVYGYRFREHRATKDQVQKYATAMKHGANFPAIVVNDAHELIDGNTRRAASAPSKKAW